MRMRERTVVLSKNARKDAIGGRIMGYLIDLREIRARIDRIQ